MFETVLMYREDENVQVWECASFVIMLRITLQYNKATEYW